MTVYQIFISGLTQTFTKSEVLIFGACETALGELKKGEGLISLAYSFACVGAKSIVTTLWPVNDKMTSILMVDFYKYIKGGSNKGEALADAQRTFLKNLPLEMITPILIIGLLLF